MTFCSFTSQKSCSTSTSRTSQLPSLPRSAAGPGRRWRPCFAIMLYRMQKLTMQFHRYRKMPSCEVGVIEIMGAAGPTL